MEVPEFSSHLGERNFGERNSGVSQAEVSRAEVSRADAPVWEGSDEADLEICRDRRRRFGSNPPEPDDSPKWRIEMCRRFLEMCRRFLRMHHHHPMREARGCPQPQVDPPPEPPHLPHGGGATFAFRGDGSFLILWDVLGWAIWHVSERGIRPGDTLPCFFEVKSWPK